MNNPKLIAILLVLILISGTIGMAATVVQAYKTFTVRTVEGEKIKALESRVELIEKYKQDAKDSIKRAENTEARYRAKLNAMDVVLNKFDRVLNGK